MMVLLLREEQVSMAQFLRLQDAQCAAEQGGCLRCRALGFTPCSAAGGVMTDASCAGLTFLVAVLIANGAWF